jgi:hypothetical protein
MTPYSLAFTTFRLVAVMFLLLGAYRLCGYFVATGMPEPDRYVDFIVPSLRLFLRGGLLYGLAHWLAKATIWMPGQRNSN